MRLNYTFWISYTSDPDYKVVVGKRECQYPTRTKLYKFISEFCWTTPDIANYGFFYERPNN